MAKQQSQSTLTATPTTVARGGTVNVTYKSAPSQGAGITEVSILALGRHGDVLKVVRDASGSGTAQWAVPADWPVGPENTTFQADDASCVVSVT